MTNSIRGIDHVGLTVPDLDAATRFLAGAFGAETIYDSHLRSDPPQQGEKAMGMLGLRPDTAVVAIRLLRLANGASIELFEARSATARSPGTLGDIGLHHFAIYCDDVVEATARAKAAGATPLAGPNPLTGVEAGDGNCMHYVRTPWGMLIELIAYPAGVASPTGIARWSPSHQG